jgi:hypothetical protein
MNTEADIARDGGPFSTQEALVALDFHATKALKRGDTGCYTDLCEVSNLIERLLDDNDELRSAGGKLMRDVMAIKASLNNPIVVHGGAGIEPPTLIDPPARDTDQEVDEALEKGDYRL